MYRSDVDRYKWSDETVADVYPIEDMASCGPTGTQGRRRSR
jgi:hypothetical protein